MFSLNFYTYFTALELMSVVIKNSSPIAILKVKSRLLSFHRTKITSQEMSRLSHWLHNTEPAVRLFADIVMLTLLCAWLCLSTDPLILVQSAAFQNNTLVTSVESY